MWIDMNMLGPDSIENVCPIHSGIYSGQQTNNKISYLSACIYSVLFKKIICIYVKTKIPREFKSIFIRSALQHMRKAYVCKWYIHIFVLLDVVESLLRRSSRIFHKVRWLKYCFNIIEISWLVWNYTLLIRI